MMAMKMGALIGLVDNTPQRHAQRLVGLEDTCLQSSDEILDLRQVERDRLVAAPGGLRCFHHNCLPPGASHARSPSAQGTQVHV